MAKKKTQPETTRTKKAPANLDALNTPEFKAAWETWCCFTTERGIELSEEDKTRQLALLAKMGPEKAIEDIHKTMDKHPLKDNVPAPEAPAKAETGKKAKATKSKAEPKEKKMSALDAAAKVLEEAGAPMNCQEMIAAMASKGYWTSPGGQTPHAVFSRSGFMQTVSANMACPRVSARTIIRGRHLGFCAVCTINSPPHRASWSA